MLKEYTDRKGNVECDCCGVSISTGKAYSTKQNHLICEDCINNPIETIEMLLNQLDESRSKILEALN